MQNSSEKGMNSNLSNLSNCIKNNCAQAQHKIRTTQVFIQASNSNSKLAKHLLQRKNLACLLKIAKAYGESQLINDNIAKKVFY